MCYCSFFFVSGMEPNIPCGPYDRSLLVFQDEHVSTDIWAGFDRGKLNVRQGTSRLADWELIEAQKYYIDAWGFGVFCDSRAVLQNDIGLISSLVERWRPETNSFHFPFGEMTITLEDVYMLLGLPVHGRPIILEDLTKPKAYWMRNWPDPNLSRQERDKMHIRGGISLRLLRETYCTCPDDADDATVRVYSLAYVLFVIGSVLFPSSSGDVVHAKYLQLLIEHTDIISYAWGAGVLGYLYRGLYKACRKRVMSLEGCLTLVQLWSYERLVPGRPRIAPGEELTWPRALAWGVPLEDRYDNPHHHLRVYRGYFDTFDHRWLTWEPYAQFYMTDYDEFEVGRHSGLSRVPLLHWNIVEYHMSDRVLRQFGVLQHIPGPPVDMWELRREMEIFHRENYIVTLSAYVHEWAQFSGGGHYFVGEQNYCPIEEYMKWYIRVTKLKISPYNVADHTRIQPRDWCNQLNMVNGVRVHHLFHLY